MPVQRASVEIVQKVIIRWVKEYQVKSIVWEKNLYWTIRIFLLELPDTNNRNNQIVHPIEPIVNPPRISDIDTYKTLQFERVSSSYERALIHQHNSPSFILLSVAGKFRQLSFEWNILNAFFPLTWCLDSQTKEIQLMKEAWQFHFN